MRGRRSGQPACCCLLWAPQLAVCLRLAQTSWSQSAGRGWPQAALEPGASLADAALSSLPWCLPPHAGVLAAVRGLSLSCPISEPAGGSARARTPRCWGVPPARTQVLGLLSAAPTASPGGGWGEQGSGRRSQGLRPQRPGGAPQAPKPSVPITRLGRLPRAACARRSTGLCRRELGTGRVLCVQTQLRRGKVCRARVVAACPWNPRPGDPQRSRS